MPVGPRAVCLFAAAVLPLLGACAQTSNNSASQNGPTTQQQAQLNTQNKQLEDRARALDVNNRELETQLAQSRQQTLLLQDQLAAVKEQLGTVNTQLAQLRDERRSLEQRVQSELANRPGDNNEVAKRPNVFSNSSFARKSPELAASGIEARIDGETLRIELPADKLFDSGDARLRRDATMMIDQILVEVERQYPQQYIGIEGNTDSDPPTGGLWPNNHQLSTARALAVYDYLIARSRLRPNQLSVVGHGANHPLVSNATAAGKARNRRIELVIYPERLGER